MNIEAYRLKQKVNTVYFSTWCTFHSVSVPESHCQWIEVNTFYKLCRHSCTLIFGVKELTYHLFPFLYSVW